MDKKVVLDAINLHKELINSNMEKIAKLKRQIKALEKSNEESGNKIDTYLKML